MYTPSRNILPLLAVLVVLSLECTDAGSIVVPSAAVTAAAAVQKPLGLTGQQHATQQLQEKQQKQQGQSAGGPSAAQLEAANVLPGEPDPASQAMIEWLVQHGGEVNVAIRRNVPGSGRGTFAPRDMAKGEVLARFPVEMAYALAAQDDSLAMSGSYLMADMSEEDSPWAPYFKALPGPSSVWSLVHVPLSYLPLIQDNTTELAIREMQEHVQQLWQSQGYKYRKVLGPNVSAANITYSMGLLLTRLFRFDDKDILLPIVDMANHDNTCLHSHLPEPCDPEQGFRQWEQNLRSPPTASTAGSGVYGAAAAKSNSSVSGQCFVWRAETPLHAGQEVCNSYKTLLQDRALLQYGFLQTGPPALELSMLDRPDFIPTMEHVWDDPQEAHATNGPRKFEGTPAQLWAEVDRLTARLDLLTQGDAAAAAIKRDAAGDPDGRYLSMMLEWRRQRKQAIRLEIPRLVKQALRLEKAQKTWSLSGADASASAGDTEADTGLTTVNRALLQWLEANGAEVNVELKHLWPEVSTPINSTPQQVCTATYSGDQQSCAAESAPAHVSTIPNAGVFTRKQIKEGEVLAVIPAKLSYRVKPGLEKLDSAVELLRDIHAALDIDTTSADAVATLSSSSTPSNSSAAFIMSLPPFGTVHSPYNFPAAYLPLLQSSRVEKHIKTLQKALSKTFEKHRPELESLDNSTTFAELQHTASLVSTKPLLHVTISGQEQQLLMPLFLNARHNSSCLHDYHLDSCPGKPSIKAQGASGSGSNSSVEERLSNLCFYWKAGTDLPAGAEVCVSYGHLRMDQAVLMYGLPAEDFAQGFAAHEQPAEAESSSPLWLHGMDTEEATADKPFGVVAAEPLQQWTPATREEALAESLFLIELHQNWTSPEATANFSTLQPVASDAFGTFLDQLMLWREHRIAVVEWELGRLSDAWNISSSELLALSDRQHAGGLAAGPTGQQSKYALRKDFESNSTDPWQRLLDWMRHNGAIINVNVTYAGPQYGRVVIATEPVTRGDLLAAIPVELTWNTATSGGNSTMQLAAANFWAEIDNVNSPYRPYLDALPAPDETMCPLVSMPKEYYHLMQSDAAVHFLEVYQSNIMGFWDEFGEDMMIKLPSMTLDTFQYARALLATRLFGLEMGASMIPLLDLANHAPNCPNLHTTMDCPHDPDRQCVVWTAGNFLPQGAEVCNGYKFMPNDRSMLQYGFLQSGPIKDHLHTIDYPGTNTTNMFTMFDKLKYGPPPFDGNAEEIKAEISRLEATLANVTAGDAEAAATQAAPSDKGGRLLSMLLTWREERKATLEVEIARLQQRLTDIAEAAAGKQTEVPLEEELVNWLTANGAQVNGVRIGVLDASPSAGSSSTRTWPAASAGRGVYATQPIKQGSLMAAIPLDLALPVATENLLVDGPLLFSEITNPLAPRAPYFTTLPAHTEVFSFYEMPVEYSPVVQHAATETFVRASIDALTGFKETNPEQFTNRHMTMDDLKHIFSLVATRLSHFKVGGHLVPFLDMANHRNDCRHRVGVTSCDELLGTTPSSVPSGPSILNTTRMCVYWKAGTEVRAGEEVCLQYGYILPDRAMLQYGFIPKELQEVDPEAALWAGAPRIPLFGLDRHEFDDLAGAGLPWRFWLDSESAPEPFKGSRRETANEIMRLELLAEELAAGDAAAAAVQPVTSVDPDGSVLERLKFWRQLRKAAIAQEIQRLQQLQQL